MIPDSLREAIEEDLSRYSFAKLKAARERLTDKYRLGVTHKLNSPEERAAYIATRMPATFAALTKVLSQVPLQGKTLLDLGAGPGGAYYAAQEASLTHIEHDPEMIALARRLRVPTPYIQGDFRTLPFPASDIALFSYSFNESLDINVIHKAWQACHTLILLEPGTPRGFANILSARAILQPYLIAPCPHRNACPLEAPDWCHFAVRVPRLKWHKDLKDGTLGYEDEKFSYLIASKTPATATQSRLLAPPKIHGGHLQLRLCTADGITNPILTKKSDLYKTAKKLGWGDSL